MSDFIKFILPVWGCVSGPLLVMLYCIEWPIKGGPFLVFFAVFGVHSFGFQFALWKWKQRQLKELEVALQQQKTGVY